MESQLTSTRTNPLVDPALHVWGWEIPVYLYLGGLVAGILVLAGYHILRARKECQETACPQAPILGIVLLSIGMLALFLDLEHPLYAWRVYLTFQITSPMSWGSWILLLVYPALIAAALCHPPEKAPGGRWVLPSVRRVSAWVRARPRLVKLIAMVNIVVGVGLGIYTGVLLGTLGARPLWNSAILGPLFLFSGLSTAAALLHVLTMVQDHGVVKATYADFVLSGVLQLLERPGEGGAGRHGMVRADAAFLSIEGALIALYLVGLATSAAPHQEAVRLLISGAYAPVFWCFVMLSGILLPLFLQYMELAARIRHTAVPALLVLAGGFLLRWVLVNAGQASGW